MKIEEMYETKWWHMIIENEDGEKIEYRRVDNYPIWEVCMGMSWEHEEDRDGRLEELFQEELNKNKEE